MNPLTAMLWMSEPASNVAGWVDDIFFGLLAVCALVTAVIGLVILVFCVRYRAGGPPRWTPPLKRSGPLELTWSAITLVIFLGFFVWAAAVYARMMQPPSDAQEIHVVAKQWMWKIQHLNGRREINALHLQIGRPVRLVMTSQDVIHSFFVPAIRTKQDVLPDRYTSIWFTPTRLGTYHLFCAEYCGGNHSRMQGTVHVLDPAEYAKWLAGGEQSESVISAGARLFTARGCSGCHAPHGSVRAPLLDGIFNRPIALSDGSVIRADEQYLHDSILIPNKQITAGYEPLMPVYQDQLNQEEVMQLVAYIKSLRIPEGGAP
jgi:cytochrome c oxidase subunit 2